MKIGVLNQGEVGISNQGEVGISNQKIKKENPKWKIKRERSLEEDKKNIFWVKTEG